MHDTMISSKRRTVLWLLVDASFLVSAGLGILVIQRRPPWPESLELLESPSERLVVYGGALLLAVVALALAWTTPRFKVLLRAVAYTFAALLFISGAGRYPLRSRAYVWPPVPERSLADHLEKIRPLERAVWAARVASHQLGNQLHDGSPIGDTLTVPVSWPLPTDVTVAIDHARKDTLWIWARTTDGAMACTSLPARGMSMACDSSTVRPASLNFVTPVRLADNVVDGVPDSIGDPWPQYRHDATRSGNARVSDTTSEVAHWHAQVNGEVRSSISVVGPLAIVGTHGSGSLEAFDIGTGVRRWAVRLPNWIHQDAVSDGRIVVVGFGDNTRSFIGRTPSGVAAFAAGTGEHLWTVFDESSVMTSPIVRDSVIVYGTATGIARSRLLRTGVLLYTARLPQAVIMGPPAAVGDTVIFPLDPNEICALRIPSLATLWCRSVPWSGSVGHASLTVTGGVVIASSFPRIRAMTLREFLTLPLSNELHLLWSTLVPPGHWGGQRFDGYDLHDGHRLWRSRVFGEVKEPVGHTSGTATVIDNDAVIVLPDADTLVGFSPLTGNIRWTASALRSRGPALIVNGSVIVFGSQGFMQARAVRTGALICTNEHAIRTDRAGPTLAGNRVVVAALDGHIEGMSLATVAACGSP